MRSRTGRERSPDPHAIFHRALVFEKQRQYPHRKVAIGPGLLPVPPFEMLTPDELADRLKVTRAWISEKRRPRCAHPLPAVTTRPLRFNWYAIIPWLQEEAKLDEERLKHKRALPVRHRKNKAKVA